MAFQNHNVTGEITRELLASGDGVDVSSISLCNIHATLDCSVDLYMEKKLIPGETYDVSYGKFYILKNTTIPVGATLFHSFGLDNSKFGLYIKLTKSASETPAVDVILQ